MTQNLYEQYQQQVPQGPPPGWPPGAAPAPQYQPPAPAPTYGTPPAPAGQDGFGTTIPEDGFDGDAPALHQLAGRLIFWRPRKNSITLGTPYGKPNEQEEKMRVDLIVLDGPPIAGHVNGDTNVETPFATGPKQVPFFIGGAQVNKVILKKLREYHSSADPAATLLARFVKTPPKGQGKPYNDLQQATEADVAMARPVFPRWDELKAAAAPPAGPDQFSTGVQDQQGPPPAWAQPAPVQQYQAPAQQGPPPGYGQQPQAPASPPPGWAPTPIQQVPQGPPPGWPVQPTH